MKTKVLSWFQPKHLTDFNAYRLDIMTWEKWQIFRSCPIFWFCHLFKISEVCKLYVASDRHHLDKLLAQLHRLLLKMKYQTSQFWRTLLIKRCGNQTEIFNSIPWYRMFIFFFRSQLRKWEELIRSTIPGCIGWWLPCRKAVFLIYYGQ